MADFTDAFNRHRSVLNSSLNALEEENIAHEAPISLFRPLQRQVSDLNAQKVSFKVLNQELTLEALSAPHKKLGQEVSRLPATIPTGVFGTSLKVQQRLASWAARDVSKFCLDHNTSTPSWHN